MRNVDKSDQAITGQCGYMLVLIYQSTKVTLCPALPHIENLRRQGEQQEVDQLSVLSRSAQKVCTCDEHIAGRVVDVGWNGIKYVVDCVV